MNQETAAMMDDVSRQNERAQRERYLERIGRSLDDAAAEVSDSVYRGACPIEDLETPHRKFTGHGHHARQRIALLAQYLLVLGWHDREEADRWFAARRVTREEANRDVYGH